ncbi:hypothetical protein JCM6882_005880 [Rhodosporidiobolus microsporus]
MPAAATTPPAEPARYACTVCSGPATTACTGCKQAYFCGATCQKLLWKPVHRHFCKGKNVGTCYLPPLTDKEVAALERSEHSLYLQDFRPPTRATLTSPGVPAEEPLRSRTLVLLRQILSDLPHRDLSVPTYTDPWENLNFWNLVMHAHGAWHDPEAWRWPQPTPEEKRREEEEDRLRPSNFGPGRDDCKPADQHSLMNSPVDAFRILSDLYRQFLVVFTLVNGVHGASAARDLPPEEMELVLPPPAEEDIPPVTSFMVRAAVERFEALLRRAPFLHKARATIEREWRTHFVIEATEVMSVLDLWADARGVPMSERAQGLSVEQVLALKQARTGSR